MTEIRGVDQASEGDGRTLVGYAIRADEQTTIAGLFRERISLQAIRSAVANADDVLALYDHDFGRVLGRTKSGTLRLKADVYGLRFELDAPETPDGVTAVELVRRRDIVGMSFGFTAQAESWSDDGDLPLRTVDEFRLVEVSAVVRPAYPTTSVALRGLNAHRSDVTNAARRTRMRMRMDLRLRGIAL